MPINPSKQANPKSFARKGGVLYLYISLLAIASAISSVGSATAQPFSGGFTLAGPSNSAITYFSSTHSADLDGDGDSDVIAVSETGIAWYRNGDSKGGGDGTVWAGYVIDTRPFSFFGRAPDILFAEDLDGDGDLDVIAGSDNLNAVLLYRNGDKSGGGDGTSWTQVEIDPSINDPRSVHAADMDGDGDMDVLSTSFDSKQITWYRNGDASGDGDGTTWTESTIATSVESFSAYGADVDGDGDTDVVAAIGRAFLTDANSVVFYRNGDASGGGLGLSWTRIEVADLNGSRPQNVRAGDIDADGDVDIISSIADGRLAWHRNGDSNGGGNASSWTLVEIGGSTSVANFSRAVRAGDVDGDGDLDVISNTSGQVDWYQNGDGNGNGDGSSWSSTSVVEKIAFGSPLAIGDLDGDSDLDILAGGPDDGSLVGKNVSWYRNGNSNGDGDGLSWTPVEISNPVYSPVGLYAADIDGDGDPDALSAPFLDIEIAWYQNGDSGGGGDGSSWNFTEITTSDLLPLRATGVHAGDMDGDGDLDALFATAIDSRIAWYRNNDGSGSSWTQITITASALGARDVYAADIDGDGDLDAVSASSVDDKIVWYRNGDSSGGGDGFAWTPFEISTTANGAWAVYAADVDQDGDTDVLSASKDDDTITWYRNGDTSGGGDGSSWSAITIAAGGFLSNDDRDVAVGDIDGDGDLDVLSASFRFDEVAWYRNGDSSGGGDGSSWSPITVTTDADGASSVHTADVDSDGDLDILATESRGNKVVLYVNGDSNGGGDGSSWTAVDLSVVAGGASSVFTSDVDGDGDLDIFYASEEDDAISLLENRRITEVPEASFTRFAFRPGQISFDGTGVSISFDENTAGSGNVTVSRLSSPPTGTDGIPQGATVSSYRTIINAEAGLTFGGGTQVRFDASQFDGIGVPEDVDVYARPSVNFGTFSLLTTEYLAATNEIAATVTGFSEFVFASGNANNPLPVEPTTFDATLDEKAVMLQWSTASETNNAGFEVQMRGDLDDDFAVQGFVEGQGTTSAPQQYRYRLAELTPDTYAFRLKQVDFDGGFEYSPEVEVTVGLTEPYVLSEAYPNPFQQVAELTLTVREVQHVRAEMFDVLGRRVALLHDGPLEANRAHRLAIDGRDLASGLYLVRVVGERFAETRRVMVAR